MLKLFSILCKVYGYLNVFIFSKEKLQRFGISWARGDEIIN